MQNHQASKNLSFKILFAEIFALYNPGLIAKYRLIMKQLLKQYAWILSICSALILLLLLTGCNQAPFANKPLQESVQNESTESSAQDTTNSIGNMETIGRALGCVFAPDKCNQK